MTLGPDDAARLGACLAQDGVCVLPTDTVYGLACSPDSQRAVERLYRLKGRDAQKPAAVMFFTVEHALAAVPELAPHERTAIEALLPCAVTLLLPNRARRFPLACGPDPDTLGLRVPLLSKALHALGELSVAVMQSSANLSGGPEPRRLGDVPPALLENVDLALDGGELPGVASTVVDLREYQMRQTWRIMRQGPVNAEQLERLLSC